MRFQESTLCENKIPYFTQNNRIQLRSLTSFGMTITCFTGREVRAAKPPEPPSFSQMKLSFRMERSAMRNPTLLVNETVIPNGAKRNEESVIV